MHGLPSRLCMQPCTVQSSSNIILACLANPLHHQDDNSRFVESFKKKFVGQEVEALNQRLAPLLNVGVPVCECLVGARAKRVYPPYQESKHTGMTGSHQ